MHCLFNGGCPMASTTPRQRRTTGRVMHEFKHGELKSGPAGKGGKVKSRRQAIAIALKEAGASPASGDRGQNGFQVACGVNFR